MLETWDPPVVMRDRVRPAWVGWRLRAPPWPQFFAGMNAFMRSLVETNVANMVAHGCWHCNGMNGGYFRIEKRLTN